MTITTTTLASIVNVNAQTEINGSTQPGRVGSHDDGNRHRGRGQMPAEQLQIRQ